MPRQTVISHVIFDCDGVLVDSEMLSAGVLMGMMAEIGLPITDEIFRADFLGRSFASAAARAELRFGRAMPDDFQLRYRDRLLSRMREALQPMPGVFAVLQAMSVPYWLATSSSPQRLAVSLEVTGLAPFFDRRSSTASEVARGKPEPDLFLYAASKMATAPERCIVLEDSEMGLVAARAAGMTVWHFAGGSHIRPGDALSEQARPDRVIADMAELRSAFTELGLCQNATRS